MEQASNEYLRNAVMTASPEQLHLMLYDGAIRFTRQGIEGIETNNFEQAYNGFTRAQKIVLEMLNSLNYDVDRALCERMAGLYHFLYTKLVESSTNRDPAKGREALEVLQYQRETWVMLIQKLQEERVGSAASSSDSQPSLADEPEYGSLSVEG